MAPVPVPVPTDGDQNGIHREEDVPSNPKKIGEQQQQGGGGEEVDDRPWMVKNRKAMIGVAVIAVIALILIIVLAVSAGDDDDGNKDGAGQKEVDTPTVAPTVVGGGPVATAPTPAAGTTTGAPTTLTQFLDKDGDGASQLECDVQPYFDSLGRLVFPSCNVLG